MAAAAWHERITPGSGGGGSEARRAAAMALRGQRLPRGSRRAEAAAATAVMTATVGEATGVVGPW